MKIAVSGYYGMGNFGDELFLQTFQQSFKSHSVYPWNSKLDPDQTDAVIIGGGDLITPYHFNAHYFPPELKDKPMWLYGVGIVDAYPEETWPEQDINRYREYIGRAQRAVFRDTRSAEIAEKLHLHPHVETAPDMVFAYHHQSIPYRSPSNKPTIGLCIFAYTSFPFNSFVELMCMLSSKGYHLRIIPVVNHALGGGYSDYPLCERLLQKLQQEQPHASADILPLLSNQSLTYSAIQSVDYLISFKLHPALAAMRAGIPALSFSDMGKVKSLYQLFGLGHYCLDYKEPLMKYTPVIESFLEYGSEFMVSREAMFRKTERDSLTHLHHLRLDIEHFC